VAEIAFETGRFIFMIGIVIFIGWVGWSRHLLENWAWRFSLVAFVLLLFGASVDVIDDYEATINFFAWKDSPFKTFLEKGLGYLGGIFFMSLAAWRWLPHSDALKSEKQAAENSQALAEGQRDVLRDQLIQAQKMEAIGQLTGGIAHDFNNLLMVIDGYSRRARENLNQPAIVEESLEQVANAVLRTSALTKQLLVFSRRQSMEKDVARIGDLISGAKGLLKPLLDARTVLLVEVEDGAACIETDSNEFCQTLLNLAINARDAMPDGGILTIGSRLIGGDNGAGKFVEVSVTDTGQGMDEETAARIFEPFFTTKEQGKGTGLGLATAYGFAQASGGEIKVESTPGSGTTMRLIFPEIDRAPAELAVQGSEMPRGGGETILLVEDNESLLNLIHETLSGLGYNVTSAPSGFEALDLVEDPGVPLDLLLTDVIMPGLSGIEVAQVVRSRRPKTKVIFLSGYTGDAGTTGQMPPGSKLLQKPVDMKRLAEVLRSELDQPEMLAAS